MEFSSGNVFIRQMTFDRAGDTIDGHAHNFDHTTYVPKGAVRIEALDPQGNVTQSVDKRAVEGRNWALIKAGVCHRLTALEDGSIVHCVYSHRVPQGDVVQAWDGWRPCYV